MGFRPALGQLPDSLGLAVRLVGALARWARMTRRLPLSLSPTPPERLVASRPLSGSCKPLRLGTPCASIAAGDAPSPTRGSKRVPSPSRISPVNACSPLTHPWTEQAEFLHEHRSRPPDQQNLYNLEHG